jgi:hypothetical protein
MPGYSAISPAAARLKHTAKKIYSRMQYLGLNETELSERCLAAIHMFEDLDLPSLTRDRISKILMNRREAPAKSSARVITHGELAVLANVLKVSIEWLMGQEKNRDPVVWNVLAQPDRVLTFSHLLQEYEEMGKESVCWSQFPMCMFTSDDFSHAFNHVHYSQKLALGNTKPLSEFYNSVARVRRKWILKSNRSFAYTNLIYQSHFEEVTCGQGVFSRISKAILRRNLDVMTDVIANPSFDVKLVILKDEDLTLRNSLRNYEVLGTVDNLISVWNYHNGDIGWSEHSAYVKPHRQLLERLLSQALYSSVDETVGFIESLRSRLR